MTNSICCGFFSNKNTSTNPHSYETHFKMRTRDFNKMLQERQYMAVNLPIGSQDFVQYIDKVFYQTPQPSIIKRKAIRYNRNKIFDSETKVLEPSKNKTSIWSTICKLTWILSSLLAMFYHIEITTENYFQYRVSSTTSFEYKSAFLMPAFSFCFRVDYIAENSCSSNNSMYTMKIHILRNCSMKNRSLR